MVFRRSLARLISQCLLAVLMLQVMLPSWAAFVAPGTTSAPGKAAWMEICAAGGIQWIRLAQPDVAPPSAAPSASDSASAPAADHQLSHEHCLLCSATGATPEFSLSSPPDASRRSAAVVIPAGPHSHYAGHAILPRAPPA